MRLQHHGVRLIGKCFTLWNAYLQIWNLLRPHSLLYTRKVLFTLEVRNILLQFCEQGVVRLVVFEWRWVLKSLEQRLHPFLWEEPLDNKLVRGLSLV